MAQISLPHQLVNGTAADASQVMANFNAIVNVVNGNLGSDNLGSITGAEVTTVDLNGGTTILDNFTQRFQAGSITFNDIPSGEYASRKVTFPTSFPGTPYLFIAQNVGTPDNLFVSYTNVSSTEATIVIKNDYRTARPTITVPWLAIYPGSMS